MKDMEVDAREIAKLGGVELSLMSTTADINIALKYAQSRCVLVFKYKTQAMTRGSSIQFLSLYPKENEVLYPPLTFLTALGELYQENCINFLELLPDLSAG